MEKDHTRNAIESYRLKRVQAEAQLEKLEGKVADAAAAAQVRKATQGYWPFESAMTDPSLMYILF